MIGELFVLVRIVRVEVANPPSAFLGKPQV